MKLANSLKKDGNLHSAQCTLLVRFDHVYGSFVKCSLLNWPLLRESIIEMKPARFSIMP